MLEQGFAAAAGAAARMSGVAPVDPAGLLMLLLALAAILSIRIWMAERAREAGRTAPRRVKVRTRRYLQP